MRRGLDLASSLLTQPRVLFLDEPTTGLDPRSRNEIWSIVRELVRGGTTVLLTTQYLEEADQLAEQIAVIDHGRIVAEGTSAQLKAKVGASSLRIRVLDGGQRSAAQAVLGRALRAPVHLDADPLALSAPLSRVADATDVGALVGHAMTELSRADVAIAEVSLGQPSLHEAFLALTGHPADSAPTGLESAN